ncbi:class I SAM-dependent methyltransferase [Streptomyces sp. NPDC050560]|uniref:class I SAM-dependent methyltransferase n=1 Tax=Streptomyces sp. NPDC050560 TaxID=3365630 RepID=UPI0037A2722A
MADQHVHGTEPRARRAGHDSTAPGQGHPEQRHGEDGEHAGHATHAGHAHGHAHADLDWAAMGPVLERSAAVYAPVYRRIAAWLGETVPAPRLVADVGSGPGVVTCLLAEHFPGARAVAVDGEGELLTRARERAARLGLSERVDTLTAQLPGGLETLGPVDLTWAGRSLHHVGDQLAAIRALAARTAPGGVLALLEGGLPSRCLPRDTGVGRPGLESRLDAAEQELFSAMRAELPGALAVREDWPALLREAGFSRTATRTFLLDLPAPLDDETRAYVTDEFQRRRDGLAPALAPEDAAALDRLLDPESPDGLARREDVYVLAAQTVHVGVKEG